MATIRLGSVGKFRVPAGKVQRLEVNGVAIALANNGEQLFACGTTCPHDECDLCEFGEVEGHEVVCTCHYSRFDLRTGQVLVGPSFDDLVVYKLDTQDGELIVEVPSE